MPDGIDALRLMKLLFHRLQLRHFRRISRHAQQTQHLVVFAAQRRGVGLETALSPLEAGDRELQRAFLSGEHAIHQVLKGFAVRRIDEGQNALPEHLID